jgi:two-component system, chemotaxis family, chemotaxis protein CheV
MSIGLLESIDRSTQLAGHNRLALLLFRLDDLQIFGINVFKVQEVIQCPSLSWMPSAHPLISGVASIRGRMVPVIDLQQALGGPCLTGEKAPHVIVTEFNRSMQGFLVRAVDRIVHVDVGKVETPPHSPGEDGYLTAITRFADELVEIIDVEKVLAEVVGSSSELSQSVLDRIAAKPLSGRRVLVVDDSRVARNQIERVMSQIGVECILATNGREALSFLQNLAGQGKNPAESLLMLISDIEMPDMDGYALTTEIRRDAHLRGLYVLLHTSLSGYFNKAMVERVGADRFIAKLNSDELALAVLDRAHSATG